MNKDKLLQFLLEARTKTYAGDRGEVKPAFSGSDQLEYEKEGWFYRDIYYSGNAKFMGLETIYFKDKPVWSMSYYGSCQGKDEKEIYKFLKEALMENWQEARIWKRVDWKKGKYRYICEPDFEGSIEEMTGIEKILVNDEQKYQFFYGGALL